MSPISRSFRQLRRPSAEHEGRVPPGQYVTEGFPVLSAGPTLKSWTWQEFQALPAETPTVDIHCVTRWSKLDTLWRGVSVDTLLDQVEHDTPYVLAFCDGGYATNLPLGSEHGGPAGLLVPHLYFWKNAKWVRDLELLDHDQPCFWETYGYLRGPMAGTTVHGRLTWQVATMTSVIRETDSVVTIGLEVPGWPGHRAGQHLDVRLAAEDGYQAERQYSIAPAPGEPVAITHRRRESFCKPSPY